MCRQKSPINPDICGWFGAELSDFHWLICCLCPLLHKMFSAYYSCYLNSITAFNGVVGSGHICEDRDSFLFVPVQSEWTSTLLHALKTLKLNIDKQINMACIWQRTEAHVFFLTHFMFLGRISRNEILAHWLCWARVEDATCTEGDKLEPKSYTFIAREKH